MPKTMLILLAVLVFVGCGGVGAACRTDSDCLLGLECTTGGAPTTPDDSNRTCRSGDDPDRQ